MVLTLAACSTPVDEVEPAPTLAPEPTDSAVVLVEPSYQLESMPISPTWQPDDPVRYLFFDARWKEYLGERPVGEWRLSYAVAKLTLEISGRDLAGHELLHPEVASPPTPVTMLGTPAEMRTSWFGHEPDQFWVWYLTDFDGLSVLVSGTDAEIVERFATGLRHEPREISAPFSVHVGRPDGSVLKVTAAELGLDEAGILRLAENITVTTTAIPFSSP